MDSHIAIRIAAPPWRVFQLVRDLERWPELLPHYRRVEVRARSGGRVLARMVADRQFGPVALPVTWRAICWSESGDPDDLRLRFQHIRGVTSGMDVTWHIRAADGGCEVTIEHRFRRPLPVLGDDALPRIIDHWFTRVIAGRTLTRFCELAEIDGGGAMRVLRRVWVTGVGPITPIGIGRDAFWAGLQAGRSGVRAIDRFDPAQFRSRVAAQIDGFEPTEWLDAKAVRSTDRFSQFALVSGRLAVEDAGIRPGTRGHPRADRVGVYVGSALGGIAYAEAQHERFGQRGIRSVAPNLALAVFGGAAPANLGIALGVHGPVLSTANSCAAGAVAIGEAFHAIRDGRADAVVAGGVEAPLSPLAFGAFDIIRALGAGHNESPAVAARPFDVGRDGFIMGEGAAMLVLEEAGMAAARGARPYAEIRGYAATSDAYHMVQPRPDGRQAARATRLALADGRLRAMDIDYVNAHASSTPLGDVAEARALRLGLGPRGATVPVAGTKAYYGHPLGASGAIEAAICSLAMARDWAPGTLNLASPDADALAFLPNITRQPVVGPFRAILSTSFGFGGLNAALGFGRPGRA